MEDTITTYYYLLEEFLKATGHRDDPQVRLSTAEVMCSALVAAAFFGSNTSRRPDHFWMSTATSSPSTAEWSLAVLLVTSFGSCDPISAAA
jgi:hypothetical protein